MQMNLSVKQNYYRSYYNELLLFIFMWRMTLQHVGCEAIMCHRQIDVYYNIRNLTIRRYEIDGVLFPNECYSMYFHGLRGVSMVSNIKYWHVNIFFCSARPTLYRLNLIL